MIMDSLLRVIFGFFLKFKVLNIGTKYYPTNETERDYVDMINLTQTMFLELKKAHINTKKIFHNLVNEIGKGNIPENRELVELQPAEDKVNEYALLSHIIMGSDRYLYVEVFDHGTMINKFVDLIKKEHGYIVEQSVDEIVARLISKNDAIRTSIKLISFGMENNIDVRASVGMTGAAAIERAINLNKKIGEMSGVGFTKLGGEFAITFPSKPGALRGTPSYYDNYLFIDIIDSTKFIEENGREKLVEIMTDIKNFIEIECKGKIEGYREGGDDLIANLPTKDAALRAGIDSSWHALNNGARLRVGVGKSRRESGERAQMADNIKIWNNNPVMVFDVADGLYAYLVPSEFTKSVIDFILNKKFTAFLIFLFVFLVTFIGWNAGMQYPWSFGIFAIIITVLYALIS
jgi:hypothetical protein